MTNSNLEHLSLSTWEYNAARILARLSKIITRNGGRVKTQESYVITDRDNSSASPIAVNYLTYIRFLLGNCVYYYQLDSNPLFPFLLSKTTVRRGDVYSLDACCDEDKGEWVRDCLFEKNCCDDEINLAAKKLFLMLFDSDLSCIMRQTATERCVPNVHGDGFHTETYYKPERLARIDF